MRVGGQRHAPAAFPREIAGTHYIGGWMGPRAGLDGCGISCLHWDSIPGPCIPYRVAIPSEIPRPITHTHTHTHTHIYIYTLVYLYKWEISLIHMYSYVTVMFHMLHRFQWTARTAFSLSSGSLQCFLTICCLAVSCNHNRHTLWELLY
jgi:hypothetical protein